MNIYEHSFSAECPNNGETIRYFLCIRHENKIMVEEIVERCLVGVAFHEDVADALFDWFGGFQILKAYHHGVWITTARGDM